MKEENPNLDAIIMPGDFIGHGISIKNDTTSDLLLTKLKEEEEMGVVQKGDYDLLKTVMT